MVESGQCPTRGSSFVNLRWPSALIPFSLGHGTLRCAFDSLTFVPSSHAILIQPSSASIATCPLARYVLSHPPSISLTRFPLALSPTLAARRSPPMGRSPLTRQLSLTMVLTRASLASVAFAVRLLPLRLQICHQTTLHPPPRGGCGLSLWPTRLGF